MKTLLVSVICGLAAGLWAQPAATEESRSRFCAVDIYLDSKATPLAAYQVQFAVTNGAARIVGIEGGDHAAFREPPFYDPQAMQQERVIIAAFSTNLLNELPTGRTRVATVHLQLPAGLEPKYELKVDAVGDAQGKRIVAEPACEERKTNEN